MGIYADDGTGTKPTGAALLDAGTLDPTSATGDKVVSFTAQSFGPGRVWGGLLFQGATMITNIIFTSMGLVNYLSYSALGNNTWHTWAMSGLNSASSLPTVSGLIRSGFNPIIRLRAA